MSFQNAHSYHEGQDERVPKIMVLLKKNLQVKDERLWGCHIVTA